MKTYLFDFDGTLVDSMPTYAAFMRRILDDNGIKYGPDIMKIITPLGYHGTADYYINELGLKLTHDEAVGLMHKYALDAYTNTIPAKANVVKVVKQLKARGDCLNVLTASPHPMLDPCLKRLGIYDLFTNVWSCEDFATTKADPNIYHMAAERIGEKVGNIMFLDDNFNADRTAKEAGMLVCGVYDDTSAEYTAEMKALCDYYIDDFIQLPDIW